MCVFMFHCSDGKSCFATIGETKQDTYSFKGVTDTKCFYFKKEKVVELLV